MPTFTYAIRLNNIKFDPHCIKPGLPTRYDTIISADRPLTKYDVHYYLPDWGCNIVSAELYSNPPLALIEELWPVELVTIIQMYPYLYPA